MVNGSKCREIIIFLTMIICSKTNSLEKNIVNSIDGATALKLDESL